MPNKVTLWIKPNHICKVLSYMALEHVQQIAEAWAVFSIIIFQVLVEFLKYNIAYVVYVLVFWP